jgi:magnesium-transporting ATPase (P-type)
MPTFQFVNYTNCKSDDPECVSRNLPGACSILIVSYVMILGIFIVFILGYSTNPSISEIKVESWRYPLMVMLESSWLLIWVAASVIFCHSVRSGGRNKKISIITYFLMCISLVLSFLSLGWDICIEYEEDGNGNETHYTSCIRNALIIGFLQNILSMMSVIYPFVEYMVNKERSANSNDFELDSNGFVIVGMNENTINESNNA